MAIPNNFTFCASDVCTELQITGSTSLDYLMTGAGGGPAISYDDTYRGTRTCLRNFRNFELMYNICSIGTTSSTMVFDGTDMWVGRFNPGNAVKITTGGTISTYTTSLGVWDSTVDGAHFWSANQNSDNVSRVCYDGTVTSYGSVGNAPRGITYDGTYIWVAGDNITRLTTGGTPTDYGSSGVASQSIQDMIYDGTDSWFTDSDGVGGVTRVTSAGSATRYAFTTSAWGNRSPDGLVYDGTYIWVAVITSKGLVRITPATGARTYYDQVFPRITAGGRLHITFDGTYLWAAHSTSALVAKVTTGGVLINTYETGEVNPNGMAYGKGRVWVSNNTSGSVTLIGANGL